MLKIIATISNFGAKANIGGETEIYSYMIEVPTSKIPKAVKEHLEKENIRKYQTLSLSIFREDLEDF